MPALVGGDNFVLEHRASIILYNLIKSHGVRGRYLLPANVCPVVPATFLKAKIPFEFVDLELDTFCMDLSRAGDLLQRSRGAYAGIVFVRNFGILREAHSAMLQELKDLFPHLLVIDDRCIAWPEFSAEGAGDVVLYSTGYSKPVELGWGGFGYLLSEGTSYQRRELFFAAHAYEELMGSFRQAISNRSGYSYQDTDWLGDTSWRMDSRRYRSIVEKAMAEARHHKDKLNEVYAQLLPGELQMPPGSHGWRFQILTDKRDEMLKAIFEQGLFASAHYASLAGIYANQSCPNALSYGRRILNLFNDYRFNEQKARRVCATINKVLSVKP